MTILLVCLFIAVLLPYLAKLPLDYALRRDGLFSNSYPREQQMKGRGLAARAYGAHQNAFEALLVFGIAVLAAIASNHITPVIEKLAIAFIVIRVLYHILYLMNHATLRSAIWFLGLVSCLSILYLSIP